MTDTRGMVQKWETSDASLCKSLCKSLTPPPGLLNHATRATFPLP